MPITVKKRHPWIEFKNVIAALLKREMATRFGRYQLGILWLLLEPLTTVIMLGVILGPIIGRTSGEMPYAFFLLCGFIQLKNFTHPMMAGINAISANEGLLVFRQVEPIDPFIARFIFSLSSVFLSFVLFCIVGTWFGIVLSYAHLEILVLTFIINWVMGSGFGLIIGIKATRFKELEKVVQFISYPLLFLSCVFISYTSLPAEAQEVLIWNPLVHTSECLRISLFPNVYEVPDVNLLYPGIFAICVFAYGMVTYTNSRHELKQR